MQLYRSRHINCKFPRWGRRHQQRLRLTLARMRRRALSGRAVAGPKWAGGCARCGAGRASPLQRGAAVVQPAVGLAAGPCAAVADTSRRRRQRPGRAITHHTVRNDIELAVLGRLGELVSFSSRVAAWLASSALPKLHPFRTRPT